MGSAVTTDFEKQVAGFGLTTAHILYRRPDHNWLLQSYVWQAKLEGPLVSVEVAHSRLIKPAELKAINGEFVLH
ncbi:MAG: protein usg [Beijerinckiaceae bacterium]|nr:protein usg [Beijerinckiaceae bacterium]